MARITDLAASSGLAVGDLLVFVDISDTSMAATGTDKKVTVAQLLGFSAEASAQPANPATTVSATLVMMGLGVAASPCVITPVSSGKVQVAFTGQVAVATTANVVATWGPRFGTGTPPSNAAAVTGTRWGASADFTTQTATAAVKVPFAFTDVLTLTPGTAYWFDLALGVASANAASVANLSFSAVETG